MSFDAIANSPVYEGMRCHHQFILVRLTPHPTKPGKTEKFPIDWRDGSVSNAHDPSIWVDARTSCTMAQVWGAGYCPGFVFTRNDPLWFLDIDGCLQADGQWAPIARELCTALPGAAVEVSHSGRGLHLFGRGLVPPHSSRRSEAKALGLEFYTEGRFVALTGINAVGDSSADLTLQISGIVARYFPPAPVGELIEFNAGPVPEWRGPTDDDELIRRALRSKSAGALFGKKASFADLWTANEAALARAYPSDDDVYNRSQADAALAQHLAFWTGKDGARIERLMRRSALARDKWDQRDDYLAQRTIQDKALRLQREVLQDSEPVVAVPAAVSVHDIMGDLGRLAPDDILKQWVSRAMDLTREDAHLLGQYVAHQTGRGVRDVMGALKQAKDAQALASASRSLQDRVGSRKLIRHRPESCIEQTREVEALIVASALPGEYVSFGGSLAHITTKALPFTRHFGQDDNHAPAVQHIEELDEVAALERIESRVAFHEELKDGTPKMVRVPDMLIKSLLGKKRHEAPQVNGLVTHPIVLADGEILATDGLHASTGLFLAGATVPGARPYSQAEAVAGLARLRAGFLAGFEFAAQLDADVALAGLLTGLQRRVLDAAPGLAVLASVPSSGKTTIARRIHIALTGRDLPITIFPLGDEGEVSKMLLALLRRNPAMITFDNVSDGFTFRSGALSAAMTAASMEQRVLGVSKDANVPTNVLFVITGNNLSFGVDEVSRWMVCRLAPSHIRPEERSFQHADVLQHSLQIRQQVLCDVVGIVAGYLGQQGAVVPTGGSRFPAWDRLVRCPLIWAGASDVAQVFRNNSDESETVRARRTLVCSLYALRGPKDVTAKEVLLLSANAPGQAADAEALQWSLETLGAKWEARSIGHKLTALVGFAATTDSGQVLKLRSRQTRTGVMAYAVEPIPSAGFAGF